MSEKCAYTLIIPTTNHSEPSKIWKVDLDLRTPLAGTVKNITAETELERAYVSFEHTFKISFLNAYQLTAIKEFRTGNSDIFVNLPTGYARSLIYQALPLPTHVHMCA